jgi:cystathionine beta-lyase family protein involved in aluminum resistance
MLEWRLQELLIAVERCQAAFARIDQRTAQKMQRVQQALSAEGIGPHHFAGSTGYGHGDLGRAAFDAVRSSTSRGGMFAWEATLGHIHERQAHHALLSVSSISHDAASPFARSEVLWALRLWCIHRCLLAHEQSPRLQVLARVLGTEACMARAGLTSPDHALACALFACLRTGDTLVVATGAPTPGAAAVISGGHGALLEWGVAAREVPLQPHSGRIDIGALASTVAEVQAAAVLVQRAPAALELAQPPRRHYVSVAECRAAVAAVRGACPGAAVVADNRGAEFVEDEEVGAAGFDLASGTLLGAVGGSVAPEGGYIAGRAGLMDRACARMSAPGLSLDAGSVSGDTLRLLFQGTAPQLAASALGAHGKHALLWHESPVGM